MSTQTVTLIPKNARRDLPTVPLGYKSSDVGVIPLNWECRTVGSMGNVVAGKALAVRAPGQMRPYLRTKNVFDGRIELDDVLTMPMTESQFATYELHPRDVLLNEGQSLELVGRCSIYRGEYHEPCAIQNQLIRFRAKEGVSAEYAAHLFRHCQKTGVFARIAMQTTSIAHLGVSRFQKLLLPWPSELVEQLAIAAALSDVDELIGALDKLIAKKRAIKFTTMQQLLTGRIRLPGNHGKWVDTTLGDLAEIQRGASPRPIESPIWYDSQSNVGWVRISDIANSDGRTLLHTRDYLSTKGVAASRFIPAGTLIMSICATVGRPVVTGFDTCIHDGFVSFCNLRNIDQGFLFYTLKHLEPDLAAMGQTGSQANLNTDLVKGCKITLPPLQEQVDIASLLSAMDAEIAVLERRREKTTAIKNGMMQELLSGRTRLPVKG